MITVDQADIGSSLADTAASTISFVTTQAVAAGGFISLAIGGFTNTITLQSVAGGGLTWAIDAQSITGSSMLALVSAQAPVGLPAGTTITATLSGSISFCRFIAGMSLTGIPTNAPLDVAGTPLVISAATAWSTVALPIAPGSVMVGVASGLSTNCTNTPTAPSIETHDINNGAGTEMYAREYRIEPAGGTVAIAGTFSVAQTGAALAVAYKAAPSGGGGPTVAQAWVRRKRRREHLL
jgi:hypothetical protein